jgi:NADH:ubiquinone oxidoreductase subunit 3 (subunit A)
VSLIKATLTTLLLTLLAHPQIVLACPVCFDPREANQSAFIAMTIFMSLLPLSMFAGLVLWLRRRVRDAERTRRPLE